MSDETKLNTSWTLWFHDPLDNKWSIDSYKQLHDISTIEDFWKVYNFLDNNIVENSMLFLMRKGIEPLWEDKNNIDGGSFSIKVQKGNILDIWVKISIALCGEKITNTENIQINGISISPKKSFCIIKIWNNKNDENLDNLNTIEGISYDGIIYKPHNL